MTEALRERVPAELERRTRQTTGPLTTDRTTERRVMDMGNTMNPIGQRRIADLPHQWLEVAESNIQQGE